MAPIKVNSTVMRDKAQTLKKIAASISQFIDETTKEVNSLRKTWEGQAAEEAVKKYTELSKAFKEKYETILEYAKFLENAAEQWDKANRDTIQTVQNQSK